MARQVQRDAGDPAVPFGRVPPGAELREDPGVRAGARAADRRRWLHADGQARQPRREHRLELRRHLHLRRAGPAARPVPPRRLAGGGCGPAPNPGLRRRPAAAPRDEGRWIGGGGGGGGGG
eukprot:scaffold105659_cov66-Phaeocystis_antarctica.AAC.6